MKELTIEQKAKRYDKAIERAKEKYAMFEGMKPGDVLEDVFPELKESEDENVRKYIIRVVDEWWDRCGDPSPDFPNKKKMLDYLEKQGEQKPANETKPKFRAGDTIRHREQGFTCKIIAVDTEYRVSGCNGTHIPFDSQDAYELVEQKPMKLSEEDKARIERITSFVWNNRKGDTSEIYQLEKDVNWLKSLKDRFIPQSQWKPTKEQIEALENASEALNCDCCFFMKQKKIDKLIKQLKAL